MKETSIVQSFLFRQLTALACCVHVRTQDPFNVRLALLERAESDLVRAQIKARPDFGQVNVAVRRDKNMMPETDEIIPVSKRHYTPCIILRHWEEESERTFHSLTKTTAKSIKNQMWELLAHS